MTVLYYDTKKNSKNNYVEHKSFTTIMYVRSRVSCIRSRIDSKQTGSALLKISSSAHFISNAARSSMSVEHVVDAFLPEVEVQQDLTCVPLTSQSRSIYNNIFAPITIPPYHSLALDTVYINIPSILSLISSTSCRVGENEGVITSTQMTSSISSTNSRRSQRLLQGKTMPRPILLRKPTFNNGRSSSAWAPSSPAISLHIFVGWTSCLPKRRSRRGRRRSAKNSVSMSPPTNYGCLSPSPAV